MKTRYVIDTNVVMDDQTNFWKYFIEGNDLNGNNFEILIPQIVNEELDGLKKDNTSNKGYY
jgi:rRNA-processing protein FCF1